MNAHGQDFWLQNSPESRIRRFASQLGERLRGIHCIRQRRVVLPDCRQQPNSPTAVTVTVAVAVGVQTGYGSQYSYGAYRSGYSYNGYGYGYGYGYGRQFQEDERAGPQRRTPPNIEGPTPIGPARQPGAPAGRN